MISRRAKFASEAIASMMMAYLICFRFEIDRVVYSSTVIGSWKIHINSERAEMPQRGIGKLKRGLIIVDQMPGTRYTENSVYYS